ncbi:MAG: hypothetical protein U5R31_15940 [Acidimicrobiia bacterium]|nr:hypothetical protein [Acidimicrobiia bacterium]
MSGLDLRVEAGEVVALLGPTAPARRRRCRPSRACSHPSGATSTC